MTSEGWVWNQAQNKCELTIANQAREKRAWLRNCSMNCLWYSLGLPVYLFEKWITAAISERLVDLERMTNRAKLADSHWSLV